MFRNRFNASPRIFLLLRESCNKLAPNPLVIDSRILKPKHTTSGSHGLMYSRTTCSSLLNYSTRLIPKTRRFSLLLPTRTGTLTQHPLRTFSTSKMSAFPTPSSDPPKHEMQYFPDMLTALPSQSAEFRRVLYTGTSSLHPFPIRDSRTTQLTAPPMQACTRSWC